jgi:hypothetical protein
MVTDWTTATDEQILAADLIIEQGLDELSIEEQRNVLEHMNATVEEAALKKALVKLTAADREQITKLLGSQDASGVRTFLMTKVPDYDTIFQQMVIMYKRVILTGKVPENA